MSDSVEMMIAEWPWITAHQAEELRVLSNKMTARKTEEAVAILCARALRFAVENSDFAAALEAAK